MCFETRALTGDLSTACLLIDEATGGSVCVSPVATDGWVAIAVAGASGLRLKNSVPAARTTTMANAASGRHHQARVADRACSACRLARIRFSSPGRGSASPYCLSAASSHLSPDELLSLVTIYLFQQGCELLAQHLASAEQT